MENDDRWSYVYGCPSCGSTLVRAMGEIEVTCGSCGASMERFKLYVCPSCQNEVYSNAETDIICGACMAKMELAE